jgi:NTE family protein
MHEPSSLPESAPQIALALSGGGIRAMVFHLGVLKRLAELGLMERIQRLSTVSGGSLLIGLMLQESAMNWPSSEVFLSQIFPQLRMKLCRRSLQWGALRQLLNSSNWRFIFSRANLLGLALRHEWNVTQNLSDLPETPEWSINGTTAENGKRFRFKRNDLGDYSLGYAPSAQFPLSQALAVSAAFPVGFGPLWIDARCHEWKKRPWDAPLGSEQVVNIGYDALHLYDGGVYDNLGLEPFFDAGKGRSKHPGSYIIVSDAGSALPTGFSFGSFSPRRLQRIADIMSDQAHALRIRTFANFLQEGADRGALIMINTAQEVDSSSAFASSYPTTLRRVPLEVFDRLAEHGYRAAFHVERQYGLGPRRVGRH